MHYSNKSYRNLFLFCLGIFIGTAFCMKWLEKGFLLNGQPFTIIGLEIIYPKERLASVLAGLNEHVKSVLRYHLQFDFAFMFGAYPGIAALCMMARTRIRSVTAKKLFFLLAVLQLAAWVCDIYENRCLLQWIRRPEQITGFGIYHAVVITKWALALFGVLAAAPVTLVRWRAGIATL
jgi:hypothetical protein